MLSWTLWFSNAVVSQDVNNHWIHWHAQKNAISSSSRNANVVWSLHQLVKWDWIGTKLPQLQRHFIKTPYLQAPVIITLASTSREKIPRWYFHQFPFFRKSIQACHHNHWHHQTLGLAMPGTPATFFIMRFHQNSILHQALTLQMAPEIKVQQIGPSTCQRHNVGPNVFSIWTFIAVLPQHAPTISTHLLSRRLIFFTYNSASPNSSPTFAVQWLQFPLPRIFVSSFTQRVNLSLKATWFLQLSHFITSIYCFHPFRWDVLHNS